MKISEVSLFFSHNTFWLIAVGISIYLGVHGYVVLEPKWGWELALSTVVLLEAILLNVLRAYAISRIGNSKIGKITVAAFGALALSFSVSLPLLSSWEDYRGTEKAVLSAEELTEPEYYSINVIPALDEELKNARSVIKARVAEKNRRMALGDKIYERRQEKDGSIRLITGIEASTWIPWLDDEKAKFDKVDALVAKITKYKEADKNDKNDFVKKNNKAKIKRNIAKSDARDGWRIFLLKMALILFLGVASLYYTYSHSNPKKPKVKISPVAKEPQKIERPIRSKSKKFVLGVYPEAFAVISKDSTSVSVISGPSGKMLGHGTQAPQAWGEAQKSVAEETKKR